MIKSPRLIIHGYCIDKIDKDLWEFNQHQYHNTIMQNYVFNKNLALLMGYDINHVYKIKPEEYYGVGIKCKDKINRISPNIFYLRKINEKQILTGGIIELYKKPRTVIGQYINLIVKDLANGYYCCIGQIMKPRMRGLYGFKRDKNPLTIRTGINRELIYYDRFIYKQTIKEVKEVKELK